jgi:hypothetical protein
LNPIEHLWDVIDRRVRQRQLPSQSLDQFSEHNDNITIREKSETFIIKINKLASVKNKKNLNEKGTIFLLKNRKLYELLLYVGSQEDRMDILSDVCSFILMHVNKRKRIQKEPSKMEIQRNRQQRVHKTEKNHCTIDFKLPS